MAITSAAGATFTRTYGIPATITTFGSFQVSLWVKTPSAAARTFLDYTSALQIKTNASNQLTLTLDGAVVGTGATVITNDTWACWIYRKLTSGATVTHTVSLAMMSGSSVGATTTEISVTQAVTTSAPSPFIVHVPAGCSVCLLKFRTYGTGTSSLLSQITKWIPTGSGSGYLTCPWRFPNDLYDHRVVSGEYFTEEHDWASSTGTVTLDPDDPEALWNERCTAIIGIWTTYPSYFEVVPVPSSANSGDPSCTTTHSLMGGGVVTNAAVFGTAQEGLVRSGSSVAASSDYTICGWFYVENIPTTGTYRTFIYAGDDPVTLYSEGVWLGQNDAGEAELFMNGSAASDTGSGMYLGWHHIAYVRSGTAQRMYVNGGITASHTENLAAETHTHVMLGSDTGAPAWDPGRAAHVREWSAALTAAELIAESLSATAVRATNLYTDTPLASDLLDDSGNGHTWTESDGTVSFAAQSAGLVIRDDCMPANAIMDRLTLGAGAGVGVGDSSANKMSVWQFEGDPAGYLGSGDAGHYGFYDSVFIHPISSMFAGVNPSTGVAYTKDDIYRARLSIQCFWQANTSSFGPPVVRSTLQIAEFGIQVYYTGNSEGEPPEPEPEVEEVGFPCIHGSYDTDIDLSGSTVRSHRLGSGSYDTEA
jgi:hypothetical protein